MRLQRGSFLGTSEFGSEDVTTEAVQRHLCGVLNNKQQLPSCSLTLIVKGSLPTLMILWLFKKLCFFLYCLSWLVLDTNEQFLKSSSFPFSAAHIWNHFQISSQRICSHFLVVSLPWFSRWFTSNFTTQGMKISCTEWMMWGSLLEDDMHCESPSLIEFNIQHAQHFSEFLISTFPIRHWMW